MRFGAIITSEKEFLRAVSNRHIFGTLFFFFAKLEKKSMETWISLNSKFSAISFFPGYLIFL